jgi:hypothetical protein
MIETYMMFATTIVFDVYQMMKKIVSSALASSATTRQSETLHNTTITTFSPTQHQLSHHPTMHATPHVSLGSL